MRIPGRWDDTTLLQDEPFYNYFQRSQKPSEKAISELIKKITSPACNGAKAVRVWYLSCVESFGDRRQMENEREKLKKAESRYTNSTNGGLDQGTFRAFVRFYCHIYDDDESSGLRVIERLLQGHGIKLRRTTTSSLTSSIHEKSSSSINHDTLHMRKMKTSQEKPTNINISVASNVKLQTLISDDNKFVQSCKVKENTLSKMRFKRKEAGDKSKTLVEDTSVDQFTKSSTLTQPPESDLKLKANTSNHIIEHVKLESITVSEADEEMLESRPFDHLGMANLAQPISVGALALLQTTANSQGDIQLANHTDIHPGLVPTPSLLGGDEVESRVTKKETGNLSLKRRRKQQAREAKKQRVEPSVGSIQTEDIFEPINKIETVSLEFAGEKLKKKGRKKKKSHRRVDIKPDILSKIKADPIGDRTLVEVRAKGDFIPLTGEIHDQSLLVPVSVTASVPVGPLSSKDIEESSQGVSREFHQSSMSTTDNNLSMVPQDGADEQPVLNRSITKKSAEVSSLHSTTAVKSFLTVDKISAGGRNNKKSIRRSRGKPIITTGTNGIPGNISDSPCTEIPQTTKSPLCENGLHGLPLVVGKRPPISAINHHYDEVQQPSISVGISPLQNTSVDEVVSTLNLADVRQPDLDIEPWKIANFEQYQTPGSPISEIELQAQVREEQSETYQGMLVSKQVQEFKVGQMFLETAFIPRTKVEEVCYPMVIDDFPPAQPCFLPKPPLPFLPPIWAQSRQEICESFDWFRSYQGGVYHAHNTVKGYLLGAFPSSRDMFEHGGRLIISHGGGKAESLRSKKGQIYSQPASDQMAQDKSVRALFDNYVNNRPLVLLMDDGYALFPFDMKQANVAYAVLGLYTIIYAWAEYQPANNELGRVVRYKFAFRWCDHQGTPWWHREKSPHSLPKSLSGPLSDISPPIFPKAETVSVKIQIPGDDDCEFTLPSKSDELVMTTTFDSKRLPADTTYPETFLKERRKLARVCESCNGIFIQVFKVSWVCLHPECAAFWKRLDGAYLSGYLEYHDNFLELPLSKVITNGFEGLEPKSPLLDYGINTTTYAFTRGFHCFTCGRLSSRYKWEGWQCLNCGHGLSIQRPPRQAEEFVHQFLDVPFKAYLINPISDIILLPLTSFTHEEGRGSVQSFMLPHKGAKIHHIQSGNPRGRKEADEIFLKYQEEANKAETLQFRRWPLRAHKCRGSLLTNYFSQNTGIPYQYVGGDAHTVPWETAPTAVVRARQLMERRILHAIGKSIKFNEVLSAAYMERQKMAFHSDNEVGLGPTVAGLSLGSPALMHFRLNPKFDPEKQKKGTLLSVVLRHGDILVMDGAAIQDYYEHTVVPTNFRIAATARQINPTSQT